MSAVSKPQQVARSLTPAMRQELTASNPGEGDQRIVGALVRRNLLTPVHMGNLLVHQVTNLGRAVRDQLKETPAMSSIPLTPIQMSALRRVHEQRGEYRAEIVPARKIGVGPATLAALVRRGYLDKRTFPHDGYKLTLRAEKLFASEPAAEAPQVIEQESEHYAAGEKAANTVLNLGGALASGALIAAGEKAAETAHRMGLADDFLYLCGFVATLREHREDQSREG